MTKGDRLFVNGREQQVGVVRGFQRLPGATELRMARQERTRAEDDDALGLGQGQHGVQRMH